MRTFCHLFQLFLRWEAAPLRSALLWVTLFLPKHWLFFFPHIALRIFLHLWFAPINRLCVALQFDATLDVLSSIIVVWRYSNAAAVHSAHREHMWVPRPYRRLKVFEVDFVSLLFRELRIKATFGCYWTHKMPKQLRYKQPHAHSFNSIWNIAQCLYDIFVLCLSYELCSKTRLH